MNRLKLRSDIPHFAAIATPSAVVNVPGSSDNYGKLQLRQSVLAYDALHLCGGHAEILCRAYGALHDVGVYQFFSSPQARSASASKENLTAYISGLLAME